MWSYRGVAPIRKGFEPMTFAPADPNVESSVDSVLAKFGSCVFRFTLSQVPLQATTAQQGKTVVAVVMWVNGKQFAVDPYAADYVRNPNTGISPRPEFDICAADASPKS